MKHRLTSKRGNRVLAGEIAEQLGEKDLKPCRQIEAIVEHAGVEFARSLVQEARKIEAQGGWTLPDQSRRRTLGGVFFHLARARLPYQLKKFIFDPAGIKPTSPATRPFHWEERASVLETLLQEQGVVSTVKVTLIGRPGKVEIRNNLVITTMSHLTRFPNLPKGMPAPPETPTVYTVYISLKQWRRTEATLSNVDDMLIIEGVCVFDPQIRAIAVFATSLTSRVIEQNRREAQRQATTKHSTETASEITPGLANDLSEPVPLDETLQRLSELYASASVLRQKISDLERKPVGQRPGLELTQKLLANIEHQIAELEGKHQS